MNREKVKNIGNKTAVHYFTGILIGVVITFLAIVLAALVLLLIKTGREYAPAISSVCIAVGGFFAAAYTAKKIGSRGYLIGLITGLIFFVLIAVITFIVNKNGFTIDTLFKLLIIMLSSFIGGIFGVGRKAKKYI